MWYYLPQDGITVTWSLSLKKYSFIDFRGAMHNYDEVEHLLQRVADENYPFRMGYTSRDNTDDYGKSPQLHPKYHWRRLIRKRKWKSSAIGTSAISMAKERTSYSTTPTCRMSSPHVDEPLSQGLSWQNGKQGILDWTLDAFFRGLIIAKLCNDPESNFESKVRFCEKYLYDGTK